MTIMDVEELLEGSLPCAPDQVRHGDTVVTIICLGTKIAIRYIFKDVPPRGEAWQARETVNLGVFPAASGEMDADVRNDLCEEAINDLHLRFKDKLEPKTLRTLSQVIMYGVLAPEERESILELSDSDALVAALAPFFTMDLAYFDVVGRIGKNTGKGTGIMLQ